MVKMWANASLTLEERTGAKFSNLDAFASPFQWRQECQEIRQTASRGSWSLLVIESRKGNSDSFISPAWFSELGAAEQCMISCTHKSLAATHVQVRPRNNCTLSTYYILLFVGRFSVLQHHQTKWCCFEGTTNYFDALLHIYDNASDLVTKIERSLVIPVRCAWIFELTQYALIRKGRRTSTYWCWVRSLRVLIMFSV
jgi:hypothetical protein